jgi:Protein of unknown function (DUF3617)
MRFIGLMLSLTLAYAAPAVAAELPSRKPGLWEVKMSIAGRNAPPQVIEQCIDAATDQMMQSSAGPYSAAVCPDRNVQRSGDSITIDSKCAIGGKAATAHAVITGSLDGAYSMTVTSQGEALPAANLTMTIDGRWLRPCSADQKPGDMIFSNGRKVNILESQQHISSPGAPLPPR